MSVSVQQPLKKENSLLLGIVDRDKDPLLVASDLRDSFVELYGAGLEIDFALAQMSRRLKSKNSPERKIFFSRMDPNHPNAAFQHVRSYEDLAGRFGKSGVNNILLRRAIIVFAFTMWEEKYRKNIAKIADIPEADIKNDVFGDLRLYRHGIAHRGRLQTKTKVFNYVEVDQPVSLSDEQFHDMFVHLIGAVNAISYQFLGLSACLSLDRHLNSPKRGSTPQSELGAIFREK